MQKNDKHELLPVFTTVTWFDRPRPGFEGQMHDAFRKIGVLLAAGYELHGHPIPMGEGGVLQALVLWPDGAHSRAFSAAVQR